MTNYCILNNENPYTQDLSYIMNPKDFCDIDIYNKNDCNTKIFNIKSVNMESDFIVKDDINKLNYNNSYVYYIDKK